ncbi:OLC1v1013494C1 [Oldenlandia corymbosa var. corymbosa]|nr:OLC1v1013494C1 [Oldenlandia corymbosa var. corymbosa]
MQSICRNAQRAGSQTINYWKLGCFKPLRDSDPIMKATLGLSFKTFQNMEFATKSAFLMPFHNIGTSQAAKPFSEYTLSVAQMANHRSSQTCFSTMENAGVNVPLNNSDVPQRIKMKRLDKTARHIMQILDKEAVEDVKSKREIPDIRPGYFVQLKVEVPENKRRVSTVKGVVIARRNAGLNTTFRLRRSEAGVGFESLFLL